ncbi:hypothetical protein AY599_21940 [Leptolyngbya valderiana BDU 20041]|nr:BON domain-containing protein [Geitlerinema sp. CS-897]OAB63680.1 hypothetical protein AY599_21940 [Leptolyngbya valderiana BDU 20041]PPT09666.1 hypothetical protein CKA32_001040 [Geitlerinema sp. FC II]
MNIIFLTSAIATAAIATYFITHRLGGFRTIATLLCLGLLAGTGSLPALASTDIAALGAKSDTLEQGQQQLEEDLKLTPTGGQYSGIEYAKGAERGEPMTDRKIRETILSDTSEDLTVNVASGSVILSGTVRDKDRAREIVDEIKEISGVHEITFELGLEEGQSS